MKLTFVRHMCMCMTFFSTIPIVICMTLPSPWNGELAPNSATDCVCGPQGPLGYHQETINWWAWLLLVIEETWSWSQTRWSSSRHSRRGWFFWLKTLQDSVTVGWDKNGHPLEKPLGPLGFFNNLAFRFQNCFRNRSRTVRN